METRYQYNISVMKSRFMSIISLLFLSFFMSLNINAQNCPAMETFELDVTDEEQNVGCKIKFNDLEESPSDPERIFNNRYASIKCINGSWQQHINNNGNNRPSCPRAMEGTAGQDFCAYGQNVQLSYTHNGKTCSVTKYIENNYSPTSSIVASGVTSDNKNYSFRAFCTDGRWTVPTQEHQEHHTYCVDADEHYCPARTRIDMDYRYQHFLEGSGRGVRRECTKKFYNVPRTLDQEIFTGSEGLALKCNKGVWIRNYGGEADDPCAVSDFKAYCPSRINLSFETDGNTCLLRREVEFESRGWGVSQSRHEAQYLQKQHFYGTDELTGSGYRYSASVVCNLSTGQWELDSSRTNRCTAPRTAENENDSEEEAASPAADTVADAGEDGNASGEEEEAAPANITEGSEEANDHDKITALSVAIGPGMQMKCSHGDRAISFQESRDAFKAYHAKFIDNVSAYDQKTQEIQARMTAIEAGTISEGSSLTRESYVVQRDLVLATLDFYKNENHGINQTKKALKAMITSAEQKAIEEHRVLNNDVASCTADISNAIALATTGCSRTEVSEVCDANGENCEQRETPSPVAGSCEALEMMSYLEPLKEQFYNQQFKAMPTNLQKFSFDNLNKNIDRFVNSSIPDGAWKASIIQCAGKLKGMSPDYLVSCTTPQGQTSRFTEWDVPTEGTIISDLYHGILGRSPERSGLHYWTTQYNNIIASGKSEAEALSEVRNHIINSNENKGVDDTAEQIAARQSYTDSLMFTAQVCANPDCTTPGENNINEEAWSNAISTEAKFDKVIPSHASEGDIPLAQLKAMSFSIFNNVDLQMAMPYGRMEILSQLKVILDNSVVEDQAKILALETRKSELDTLINEVQSLGDAGLAASAEPEPTDSGSGGSGEPDRAPGSY